MAARFWGPDCARQSAECFASGIPTNLPFGGTLSQRSKTARWRLLGCKWQWGTSSFLIMAFSDCVLDARDLLSHSNT